MPSVTLLDALLDNADSIITSSAQSTLSDISFFADSVASASLSSMYDLPIVANDSSVSSGSQSFFDTSSLLDTIAINGSQALSDMSLWSDSITAVGSVATPVTLVDAALNESDSVIASSNMMLGDVIQWTDTLLLPRSGQTFSDVFAFTDILIHTATSALPVALSDASLNESDTSVLSALSLLSDTFAFTDSLTALPALTSTTDYVTATFIFRERAGGSLVSGTATNELTPWYVGQTYPVWLLVARTSRDHAIDLTNVATVQLVIHSLVRGIADKHGIGTVTILNKRQGIVSYVVDPSDFTTQANVQIEMVLTFSNGLVNKSDPISLPIIQE